MSIKIGMILSNDFKLFDEFKAKYNLVILKIDNIYVQRQILEDEIFFEATISGYDSFTGIGSYDLYIKDVSLFYTIIEDKKMAQSIVEEFEERKLNYKADVLKWIEIILALKDVYKVNKLGIFWHMCSDSFQQDKIIFSKRLNCDTKDISTEYLMKIEPDTLVFFA